MKIGIVTDTFDEAPLSGVGNFVKQLCLELQKAGAIDLYLFHKRRVYREFYRQFNEVKLRGVELPPSAPLGKLLNHSARVLGLPRTAVNRLPNPFQLSNLLVARRMELDLVHVAHVGYGMSPDLYWMLSRKRLLLTIHGIAPSAVGFRRLIHERTHRVLVRAMISKFRAEYRLLLRRKVRIVTSSYASKRALERYLGISGDRIGVVYLGVDHELFRPIEDKEAARDLLRKRFGIDSKFILFIGSYEPRKNLPTLLRAFHLIKRKWQIPHKLVIEEGTPRFGHALVDALIRELGLTKDVVRLRGLAWEDLQLLYNCAEVFAFPSLYEGFGLPPLEAMACGCPVVASNASALPEVVGDAAVLVDPLDVEGLAQAMVRMTESESTRYRMIQRGLRRASMFSWEKSAREYLKEYSQMVGADC